MRSAPPLRNRATAVDFIRRKACHTPLERLGGGTGDVPEFPSGNIQLVHNFEKIECEYGRVEVDVELDRRFS
jgi:hypothetical protein